MLISTLEHKLYIDRCRFYIHYLKTSAQFILRTMNLILVLKDATFAITSKLMHNNYAKQTCTIQDLVHVNITSSETDKIRIYSTTSCFINYFAFLILKA